MITSFYPPYSFGGDAVFVQQLSTALAQRGHDVHVIHCLDAYHGCCGLDPKQVDNDAPIVTVHRLQSGLGVLSPLATQQIGQPHLKTRRIAAILEQGFDVIHYHNVSLVGGPGLLALGSAIKLYTIHDAWMICPTHVLFRFNREPCLQPRCLLCQLTYRRPPQWWRYTTLLQRMVKHVDAFLAPSRFIGDMHRNRGLHIPIVTLPNFILLSEQVPDSNHGQALPYVLFVGRLERVKGLHTLIPLIRRHGRVRLLIAGRGKEEAKLRQLSRSDPKIEFVGHKSRAELALLYRQATAVIVPSVGFEVFPLVVLESFSHRTPIIARRIGGLPEIIAESGGGMVYDTDAQLLSCIDVLLNDPPQRDELGRRGRAALEKNWSCEAHLTQYLGLIARLRARSGRSNFTKKSL